MLCVLAYTYERRPYSATLYPTSFNLDSLLAFTLCAQRKTQGLCFTSGHVASDFFLHRNKKMYGCSRDTHRLGVEGIGGRNDDTTAAMRCTV